MPDPNPPTYFVLFHTPGPTWDPAKTYDQQPSFDVHVGYMDECFARGAIVLSGPFLDEAGNTAPGGMAILRCADIQEAWRLGQADPTVRNGLLAVDIKPWAAVFHP